MLDAIKSSEQKALSAKTIILGDSQGHAITIQIGIRYTRAPTQPEHGEQLDFRPKVAVWLRHTGSSLIVPRCWYLDTGHAASDCSVGKTAPCYPPVYYSEYDI